MSAAQHPANRLAQETSPYLLQHAHNPVDWFPWGDEAFERARTEDKPIFLSVGYSACHWCHVMERESFENEEIAAFLNANYVCIKVDREERPDVDQIYMTAVQLITRRGGWPMSVFLTPDGQPFYGGTYWPPRSRMGMPGFYELLSKLHMYWTNRREEVLTSSGQLVQAIQEMSAPRSSDSPLDEATLKQALEALLSASDRKHGGFGGAPKFPHPMDLRLLLRLGQRFSSQDATQHALFSLDKLAQGGIYDHLGGGFHRYATDAHWLVPHFEKMLYDNALLIPAYLEAWQLSGEDRYATIVRESLDYVLREMTQPGGGFYSTQDADSEGEEGKFFVWSAKEVAAALTEEELHVFSHCYNVTPDGNWEGHTILNLPQSIAECARQLSLEESTLQDTLTRCRARLLAIRAQRIAPGRDDKILVAWNGMMIAAAAQAGAALQEPRYLQAAVEAADFILHNMRNDDGQLLHAWKDGRARFTAYLDDYACLLEGLIELYQATGTARWLEEALSVAEQMRDRFADSAGGFFYTASDHEALIARTKDAQDNATPSGNGMAATVLLKLAALTDRDELRVAAMKTLESIGELISSSPLATGQSLMALDFLLGPSMECIFVDGSSSDSTDLQNTLLRNFLPRKIVARNDGHVPAAVESLFAGRDPQAEPQAYICQNHSCLRPVATADELDALLNQLQQSTSMNP